MPTSDPVTTSTTNTSTDPKVNPAPETDNLVIDFGETQETPVTPEENSVSELSSNTEAEQVSSGEDFVLDF